MLRRFELEGERSLTRSFGVRFRNPDTGTGSGSTGGTSGGTTTPVYPVVDKLRVFPRPTFETGLRGAKLQGSNDQAAWTDLYTVAANAVIAAGWNEFAVTNTTAYQYVRLLCPAGSFGNVAEVEFLNGTTKLTGTAFGTTGFATVFDNDTTTFFTTAATTAVHFGLSLSAVVTPPPPPPAPVYGSPVSAIVVENTAATLTLTLSDVDGVASATPSYIALTFNGSDRFTIYANAQGAYIYTFTVQAGTTYNVLAEAVYPGTTPVTRSSTYSFTDFAVTATPTEPTTYGGNGTLQLGVTSTAGITTYRARPSAETVANQTTNTTGTFSFLPGSVTYRVSKAVSGTNFSVQNNKDGLATIPEKRKYYAVKPVGVDFLVDDQFLSCQASPYGKLTPVDGTRTASATTQTQNIRFSWLRAGLMNGGTSSYNYYLRQEGEGIVLTQTNQYPTETTGQPQPYVVITANLMRDCYFGVSTNCVNNTGPTTTSPVVEYRLPRYSYNTGNNIQYYTTPQTTTVSASYTYDFTNSVPQIQVSWIPVAGVTGTVATVYTVKMYDAQNVFLQDVYTGSANTSVLISSANFTTPITPGAVFNIRVVAAQSAFAGDTSSTTGQLSYTVPSYYQNTSVNPNLLLYCPFPLPQISYNGTGNALVSWLPAGSSNLALTSTYYYTLTANGTPVASSSTSGTQASFPVTADTSYVFRIQTDCKTTAPYSAFTSLSFRTFGVTVSSTDAGTSATGTPTTGSVTLSSGSYTNVIFTLLQGTTTVNTFGPGTTQAVFTGLAAGTYTWRVVEASAPNNPANVRTGTVTIKGCALTTLSVAVTQPQTYSANGSINVSSTPAYSNNNLRYSLVNTATNAVSSFTTNVFELPIGVYNLTVAETNNAGCLGPAYQKSVEVKAPTCNLTACTATLVQSQFNNQPSTLTLNSGVATQSQLGTLQYRVDTGAWVDATVANANVFSVMPGAHTWSIRYKENTSCVFTGNINVPFPAETCYTIQSLNIASSGTSITLSWTPSNCPLNANCGTITGYEVYLAGSQTFSTPQATVDAATTTYTIDNIAYDTTYYIGVKALCERSTGAIYSTNYIKTNACPIARGFQTENISRTQTKVSWDYDVNPSFPMLNFIFGYKAASATTYTEVNVAATDKFAIMNTQPGTYQYYIKSKCTANAQQTSGIQTYTRSAFVCKKPTVTYSDAESTLTKAVYYMTDLSTDITNYTLDVPPYTCTYMENGQTKVVGSTGNRIEINGIIPNTPYTFNFNTKCSGGNVSETNTITTTFAFDCPLIDSATFRGTDAGNNAVRIDWNAPTVQAGTRVETPTKYTYTCTNSQTGEVLTATVTNPTFIIPNVLNNVSYYISVYAGCTNKNSATTNYTYIRTVGACALTNDIQTSYNQGNLSIVWNGAAGAQSYEVRLCKVNGTGALYECTLDTVTSTSITKQVLNNVEYEIQVKTNCQYNSSSYFTKRYSRLFCPLPDALAVAINASSTQTKFTWNAVSCQGYVFEYQVQGSTSITPITINGYNNNSVLVSLTPNTTYQARVRAICDPVNGQVNNSTFTSNVTYRIDCGAPLNVVATSNANGTVRVTWSAAVGNTSYRYTVYDVAVPNESYTDTTNTFFDFVANPQKSYVIKVYAVCTLREIANSTTVSTAYTLPQCAGLDGLTATVQNGSTVNVTWNPTAQNKYQYRYKKATDSYPADGGWVLGVAPNFSFTPDLNVQYNIDVRNVCSAEASYFSAISSTTAAINICPIVANPTTSFDAGNCVVAWEPFSGASGYQISYKKSSQPTNAFIVETVPGADGSFSFPVENNINYDIVVTTKCGGSSTPSAQPYSMSFINKNCPIITHIDVEEIDADVLFSWAHNVNVTNYLVEYIVNGTTTTFSVGDEASFSLEPVPNVVFTVNVRPYCGETLAERATTRNYIKSDCPLPDAIINTVAYTDSGTNMTISWQTTSAYRYGFFLKYSANGGPESTPIRVRSSSNTFSYTLRPSIGVEYAFSLQVICGDNPLVVSPWVAAPTTYTRSATGATKWSGKVFSLGLPITGLSVVGNDIWHGTPSYGVQHLSNTSTQTEEYNTGTTNEVGAHLPSNTVNAVWQTEKSIWAGTANGLWRRDLNSSLTLGSNPTYSLAIPNTNKIYVLNKDSGNVFVVDSNMNAVRGYVAVTKGGFKLYYIEENGTKYVYVLNENDETMNIIDTVTDRVVGSLVNEGRIWVAGSRAFITNFLNHTVSIMDSNTGDFIAEVQVGRNPVHATYVSNYLYVSSVLDSRVTRIDLADNSTFHINYSATPAASPTQSVSFDGSLYVRTQESNNVYVISGTTSSTVDAGATVRHLVPNTRGVVALADNKIVLINVTVSQSVTLPGIPTTGLIIGNILYVSCTSNDIWKYNLQTATLDPTPIQLSETPYLMQATGDKLYVATEKGGIHRLVVYSLTSNIVLRIHALDAKAVDMHFVANKFIYLTVANSKNVLILDTGTQEAVNNDFTTIAINKPIHNTYYANQKYYVLHRAGDRAVIINTENNYLDSFKYLENNTSLLSDLSKNVYRFVGGVDNMASIFLNGQMSGSVWHGGTWARGMFREEEIAENGTDFFDNVIADKDVQVGIWLRGLWLSGYFSYYNDRAIPGTPDYVSSNGKRSVFMGLKAGNAFTNDNIFGLSKVDLDNVKSDILDNPATSDHTFASVFSRRFLKRSTTGAAPYLSQFNGSFLNGILFDDGENMPGRVVGSLYSSYGRYHHNGAEIAQIPSSAFPNAIKHSKTGTYDISYNWSPLYYYYGQAKISDTEFLREFINLGYAVLDNQPVVWRHNHPVYGDGTSFIVNGIVNTLLPYGVSVAQGAGLTWNPLDPPGEPRYGGAGGIATPTS